MCLIDFKGHRLTAMSVLPISSETLVYGSSDGGRTIHTDDQFVNSTMQSIGEMLNIAPHKVGRQQQVIYGPG
jgi:hypothetical protein